MANKRSGVKAVSKTSIQIAFKYRGEQIRERIKIAPTAANLKKVERFRISILEAIDNGTFEYQVSFPNSKNAPRFAKYTGSNTSVEQYMKNWLVSKENEVRSSTFAGYTRIANNTIIPKFGSLKLDQLSRIDIKRWCADMPCGTKRITNILSVFRAALQDAQYDSLIKDNPLYGFQFKRNTAPVQKKDDIDPFTFEELKIIIDSLAGQNKNMLQFWTETGLRHSELCALEWGDFDLNNKTVQIWKAKTDSATKFEGTKTSAGNRVIDLSPVAYDAIVAQRLHTFIAGNEVFQNPRTLKPWSGDRQIREIFWRPALKRCGVRYRYPYQIRHSFASHRIMAATTIGELMGIAAMMGHEKWTFTATRYARFIKKDIFSHQNMAIQAE